METTRFGLFRFRSPLLTESLSLSFPRLTEMFHFRRSCVSAPILFRAERYEMNRIRLPHSEIHGSQPVCGYPRLIAAYHVLHRLPVPRHPLHTLYILHCLIHFDGSRRNRNGTQARILKPFDLNFWLYVKLFSTLYIVVKEPQKSEIFFACEWWAGLDSNQ